MGFNILISCQILEKSSITRMDDEGGMIMGGIVYYRMIFLDTGISFINKISHFLELHAQNHPHLFEFTESLSWKILSLFRISDINSMILITNSVFFIILLASIYGIGSIFYNKNVGILSAALVSMFPLVFGHSRVAMLDFPLMCMICFGFYLLLKTDKFSFSRYSILSGIVFGLSQLTKETAFIFILGPLIYYFIQSYRMNNKKKVLLNFGITFSLFMILSWAVYFRLENLHAFKIYFGKTYYIRNHTDIFYYLKNFIEMTGPFILIISLPLLAKHMINIKKREKMLLVWFIIPIILFSISPNKAIRFLFPILPAFALIVTGEIDNIKLSKTLKKIFYTILISASILQYVFFNTGILDTKLKNRYFEAGILSVKKDKYLSDSTKLLDVFKKEASYGNNLPDKKILFLFSISEINWPFWLDIYLYKLPFVVDDFLRTDKAEVLSTYGFDWSKKVSEADYIIDKTGIKCRLDFVKHISDGLEEGFIKHKDKFELISEIELSLDNSTAYVYKKVSR